MTQADKTGVRIPVAKRVTPVCYTLLAAAVSLAALPAHALQAMDDSQLASVSGRDGVDITLNTSNLSTEALGMRMNTSNTNLRGGLEMQNISYTPVDAYGRDMTGVHTGQLTIGIDGGQSATGVPGGVISVNLPNRIRFHTDNIVLFGNDGTLNENSTQAGSFGELAYDASGKIVFSNIGGLFNADGEEFMLFGKLENANMFWRQQSGDPAAPYLVMTDGETFWHAYGAHVGVDRQGLVQRAKLIDLGLEYTTRFKQPDPGTVNSRMTFYDADTLGSSTPTPDSGVGMYRFGWGGTIVAPYLVFAGGGINQNSSGVYDKEGMHIIAKWNFLSNDGESSDNIGGGYAPGVTAANFDPSGNDTDNKHTGFHWFLGNENNPGSANEPVNIELANWRNLPGAEFGSVMDIRTSVVHNGQGGANALCFGSRDCVNPNGTHNSSAFGDVVNISPTATGLGLTVRDSSIRAYSESIRARDDHFPVTVPSDVQDFDWGLINSISHLDGNIYLYPKESTILTRSDGSPGSEIVADILVMGQSLDDDNGTFRHTGGTGARLDGNGNRATNFGNGSHMLIADTGAGNALGMLDMSFMLMARETHIIMKPMTTSDDPAGQYSSANYVSSKNATAEQAYRGGLDFTSPETRYTLYATFGGLDLSPAGQPDAYDYYPSFGEACPSGSNCPSILVGGINSWNYEGFFNFRLSPHPDSLTDKPNEQYLGYSLAYRATSYNVASTMSGSNLMADLANSPGAALMGDSSRSAATNGGANPRCVATGSCSGQGTYFGTAEPHQQDALVTTGAVTGDMAFVNGKMQITAGVEVLNGGTIDYSLSKMPSLIFSHDILIGMSAYNQIKSRAAILGGIANLPGGDTKQPFQVNRMEFNGQNLGSIVVPKGRYYGTAGLKPQRL